MPRARRIHVGGPPALAPCARAAAFLALMVFAWTGHTALPVAAGTFGGFSPGDAPAPLADMWFRFHESGLCREIDAVFLFRQDGCEIWATAADEGDLQRLREMSAPLRPNYRIALYLNCRPVEKKSDPDNSPPPSLWNNDELVRSLWDPFTGGAPLAAPGRRPEATDTAQLKMRIRIFAIQLLEWSRHLGSYGAELPLLAREAWGQEAGSARQRAAAVCLAHATEIEDRAGRLLGSLSQALPRPEKKKSRPQPKEAGAAPGSPAALADELSRSSERVARQVRLFIYPREHTVAVGELEEPDLPEALRDLRRLAQAFRRSAAGR